MATALVKSPVLTRSATTRRKRNADESNEATSSQLEVISKEVKSNRRNKSLKTKLTPKRRQRVTTELTIQTTPGLRHSDSIICISDTPEQPAQQNPTLDSNHEQLQDDEEFARKLQQEFEQNYLEQIRIEKKDKEVARRLQRIEHIQQQKTFVSNNLNNPTNFNYMPPQQESSTLITNNQLTQPQLNQQLAITSNIQPNDLTLSTQSQSSLSNQIQLNRPLISNSQHMFSQGVLPSLNNNQTSRSLISTDTIQILRGNIDGQMIIQPTNTTQVINCFQPLPQSNTVAINNNTNHNQRHYATKTINTNNNHYQRHYATKNINTNNNHGYSAANKPLTSRNSNNIFDLLTSYEYPVKKNPEHSTNIDNECSICLDEYQYKILVTHLACMHKFHTSCIKSWLQNNNSCPICKKNALNGQ